MAFAAVLTCCGRPLLEGPRLPVHATKHCTGQLADLASSGAVAAQRWRATVLVQARS